MYGSHVLVLRSFMLCVRFVFLSCIGSPGPRGPLSLSWSKIQTDSRAAPLRQPTFNVVALIRFHPAVSPTQLRLLPCVCQINFEAHRR